MPRVDHVTYRYRVNNYYIFGIPTQNFATHCGSDEESRPKAAKFWRFSGPGVRG